MTQRPTPERIQEIYQLNKTERKFCELEHRDHCQEVEDVHELLIEIDALQAENEKLRMQLAGCGVAAMCNTHETRSKQSIGKDNPYWSASYGDVLGAVDREIKLREERDRLKERVGKLREAIEHVHKYADQGFGWGNLLKSALADDKMENAK